MMTRDDANRYNFIILPSDIEIKSANNALTAVVGVTEALTIDINGHTCQISFIVLEHDDHEILLGLDWFRLTGASLHPSDRVFKFPGTTVSLLNETSSTADTDTYFDDDVPVLSATVLDEDDIDADIDWFTENQIDMSPVETLSTDQMTQFNKLKHASIPSFATAYDSLGCCTISKHEILLDSRIPIFSQPYRKSLNERELLKQEVQKLLDANIIRPSRSPYASPVILVPKKDKSIRMCVDYRRLNQVTITEQWPLPRKDDILDGLLGSKWFSTLDLKSGYYQVAMSPNSIAKTAFITPDGHYEFLRLPFGLKNAPSHFSKLMFQALGDIKFVKIYLDDITIHSPDFHADVHHISQVLQRLQKANLRLNSSKCTWFASRVKLLGHIVSTNGVAMDPAKVEAVQSFKAPQNVKQVQQFLGICNYYRRFIKDFAKVSQPIATLVCKDTPFI